MPCVAWLQQWKWSKGQYRGKHIWAALLSQDIAAQLENLSVKAHHVDIHTPKSWATEEYPNNQQAGKAMKTEVV